MRKRVWAGVCGAAILLSGCAADIVFIGVQLAHEGLTLKYTPRVDGFQRLQPSLQSVTALRYQRHFLREDGKCEFHGVVVPWERIWEEHVAQEGQTNKTVLPAEPGKIAGYAAVIYQRVCPDQPPQSILHVGSQGTGFLRTRNSVTEGNYVAAQNLLEAPADERPQWTEQVLQRLVDLAPKQDAAQKAVSAAKAELLQVMPQLQSHIQE